MLASLLFSALAASVVTASPAPTAGTTISTAWYPGWASASLPVSSINWDKYTIVTYAFAITTPDPSVLGIDPSDDAIIPSFVAQARQHGTVASISIGGWIGSAYFSSAVAPANRSKFVKAVLDMVAKYNLGGVDFDWESPNSAGNGNQFSPADSDNFLAFLRELRAQPAGQNLYISAAVAVYLWTGSNGQPVTDMSGFADVLDHIALMNYDINAPWTTTGVGPNAPLNDVCSKVPNGSALKAINTWIGAGVPSNKVVLGVPAFGYVYRVTPSNAIDGNGNLADHPPFSSSKEVSSEKLGSRGIGEVAVAADTGGQTFADLVNKGFLNGDGTHSNAVKYRWDDCSQTPFVYDQNKQLMVSYDDPQSFAAKGKFVVDHNLLGFAVWQAAGDYNNLLLNSIHSAAGVSKRSG